MTTVRLVDSNKASPQKVKLAHIIIQGGYNTFLFTALSRKDWASSLQKSLGLAFLFNIAVGLSLVRTGIYFYDLIQSRNKNLGKVGNFFKEFICASILSVVTIGGFLASTAIGIASPWLFLASMMFNVAFNLGVAIQNAYYGLTIKDKKLASIYKENCKKHLVGAFIGSLVTVSFSMIMILHFAITAMSIFSACLSAYGFVQGVYAAVKTHKTKQINDVKKTENLDDSKPLVRTDNNSLSLLKQFDHSSSCENINIIPVSNPHNTNYYFYSKDRSQELFSADNPSDYLLDEIDNKIIKLRNEINRDEGNLFSEKNKRTVKLNVLVKLKALIMDPTKTIDDFEFLLKRPEFNNFFNNPFQSFFKQKSDTLVVFEAAEDYFKSLKQAQPAITEMRKVSLV